MSYLDFLDVSFEVKEVNQENGTFKGYASTFGGKPDAYRDIINEGAFSDTLKKNGANGLGIALLWQHNPETPIGVWNHLEEDKKGLYVEGELVSGVRQADEALLLMKKKAIKAMSIGYSIPKGGFEIDEEKNVRYINSADLWEISLVTFPANPRAKVSGVKQLESVSNERDLEKTLRELGLSWKESKIVTKFCKPYLREINEDSSLKDLGSTLRELNASMEFESQVKLALKG